MYLYIPCKSATKTLLKWNKEILNCFKTSYTNSYTKGKKFNQNCKNNTLWI